MAICSKCGGEAVFKSGVSRTSGKPYAGHKCTVCDNFDFQRRVNPPPPAAARPIAPPVNNEKLELLKLAVQMVRGDTVTMEEVALNLEMLQSLMRGDSIIKQDAPQDEDVPF